MAQRAYEESNQPIAVIMELDRTGTRPTALWVVNDTLRAFIAQLVIQVVDDTGNVLYHDKIPMQAEKNSLVKIMDWSLDGSLSESVTVLLTLYDECGNRVAWNRYEKAFCPPPHPAGHPDNMDFSIGIHLYWAI